MRAIANKKKRQLFQKKGWQETINNIFLKVKFLKKNQKF